MPRQRADLISVYIIRAAAHGLELLTLQRSDRARFPGDWQVVHGHIEPGEAAWQAAARELAEETALPVRRWFRLFLVETFYNPENDTIYSVPAFLAEVAPDAVCRLSDEHRACQWRRLDDARTVFRWETQRQSIAALKLATASWPQPGAGLMTLDLDALQRTWDERRRARP